MSAKVLHQHALDCLKLAAECPDLFAQEALIELAGELEERAKRIAEDARARGRRRSHPPRDRAQQSTRSR